MRAHEWWTKLLAINTALHVVVANCFTTYYYLYTMSQ
jgi:hypothetical protein